MSGDHFARIPEWLLEANVSHGAVRLYGLLDRRCGPEHTTFISRSTLAAQMGVVNSTIDRAIRELEDVGAVQKTKRWAESGDPTTNLYYLAARARLPSRVDAPTPTDARGHGGSTDAPRGSRVDAPQNESHRERELLNKSVCFDVALQKLDLSNCRDTLKQERELDFRLLRLELRHGWEAVHDALLNYPDAALPFAGVLINEVANDLGPVDGSSPGAPTPSGRRARINEDGTYSFWAAGMGYGSPIAPEDVHDIDTVVIQYDLREKAS